MLWLLKCDSFMNAGYAISEITGNFSFFFLFRDYLIFDHCTTELEIIAINLEVPLNGWLFSSSVLQCEILCTALKISAKICSILNYFCHMWRHFYTKLVSKFKTVFSTKIITTNWLCIFPVDGRLVKWISALIS